MANQTSKKPTNRKKPIDPIIYFGGEITNSLILESQKHLTTLINKGYKDIILQINSGGGNCDDALAIYDIFESSKAHFTTRVFGKANSMAVILMLLGTERLISKHSRILLHEMGTTLGKDSRWSVTELKQSYDSLSYLNEQYADIIFANLKGKILREEILGMMKKETYLTPNEALELGFVTGII